MKSAYGPANNRLLPIAQLPTCRIGLSLTASGLVEEIGFLPPGDELVAPTNETAAFLAELGRYLADPNYRMCLATCERGTPFQRRVWQIINTIPPGQTRRYGELAAILGTSARPLGQACGANPFPLLTPCHRVLASTGIGGFAGAQGGWLIATKHWLLRHEGA